MHRALTVYELLLIIFQYVTVDSRVEDFFAPNRPKRQLLWIALTCQTFARPALDVLWRELTFMPALWSFIPLARQAQLLVSLPHICLVLMLYLPCATMTDRCTMAMLPNKIGLASADMQVEYELYAGTFARTGSRTTLSTKASSSRFSPLENPCSQLFESWISRSTVRFRGFCF